MKLPRRQFLRLAASAAVLPAQPRAASALDYPRRPIHIVAGFPAGITPDIVARLMGLWLSERFGQSFIIENRPGAGGNIGAEIVVKAAPDGYTLLAATAANAINVTLYPNLNFDFIRDMVPVAGLARFALVLVVTPSFPTQTISEFIAYAKAHPGKVNFASGGIGTGPHVAAELLKMMAGLDLVHVPYRTNYFPDVLSGQVQVTFSARGAVTEYLRAGQLQALAVTSATRLKALPDVPALSEFLPGYEASGWEGICAPKNTSAEIIAVLNKEVTAAVSDPNKQARLVDLGQEPMPMTPAEFGKFIADETDKWAKVIRAANIKPE